MMYEELTAKPVDTADALDREIQQPRRDVGFVTIPKTKLREIQKVAREVGQFHIAAMIEDLLQ